MLCNAIWGGGVGVYGSAQISITKVYGPMLRGGERVPISGEKSYATLESLL